MYGFEIISHGVSHFRGRDVIKIGEITCVNMMINKFEDDKLFAQTDKYIVILDGVITNRKSLCSDKCWLDVFLEMYEREGIKCIKQLRGSFSGAIYSKLENKWTIFVDQLGTKFTYYSLLNGTFICAEEMYTVNEEIKQNGYSVHLNQDGADMLLSYGFMLEDQTIINEIKKIQPGCYITFDGNSVAETSYYFLDNTPNTDISEEDAIETIDKLFRQAIQRDFEKDVEYGLKPVVALSGGLDCRMTSFVADREGYNNQLNITFSQTGYYDQTVPQEMSSYMRHEWLFKALDNGLWLYDLDEITRITGGNVLYYTVAHGHSLVKYLNFDTLGIAHTGQLGDVTISSNFHYDEAFVFGDGAYSPDAVKDIRYKPTRTYPNKEIGLFYNRYLNGTNNGIQYLYNYTESLSPFLDIDFLEFALSIPYSLRKKHAIYKKWIIKKYPDAAQFIWESIKAKITDPAITIGHHAPIPLKRLPRKMLSKFNRRGGGEKVHRLNRKYESIRLLLQYKQATKGLFG